MSTNQPSWHCVANNGDNSPLEHGGQFVLVDKRGVYPPELWVWEPETKKRYTLILERCFPVFGDRDSVSTNRYHPDKPEWFGNEEDLQKVASCHGIYTHELRDGLCDSDPVKRAFAYYALATYHGLMNFDHDPDKLTAKEAKLMINRLCRQIAAAANWKDGLA